jgi:hypothetical protein
MAMAIIKKSPSGFLLVACHLPKPVSCSPRNIQLALSYGFLPRVACEHVFDEL